MLLTPYSFLLLMMLGFSGILALFSLLRLRKSRGAWSFIGILVSISLYVVGFALENSDIQASRLHYWEGIQKSALLYSHTPGLEGLLSDSSDHGIELPETPAGHTYEVHVQALK